MPIVIDSWEADGNGGYYIQWTDPSQPVTAYIHATPELMGEFVTHFRKGRGAPTDRLDIAREGMRSTLSDAATVQLFKLAYQEMLGDIIDLRERGLRHNTPHEVHEHVRAGGKPDDEWLVDKRPDGFKDFIQSRP